jgi:hypothetical protein
MSKISRESKNPERVEVYLKVWSWLTGHDKWVEGLDDERSMGTEGIVKPESFADETSRPDPDLASQWSDGIAFWALWTIVCFAGWLVGWLHLSLLIGGISVFIAEFS